MRNIILSVGVVILAGYPSVKMDAQSDHIVISGLVKNTEDGKPLEGVEIKVKGKNMITGTLIDGAFYLPVSTGDTIILRLNGFESRNVPISTDRYYDISLKPVAYLKNNGE